MRPTIFNFRINNCSGRFNKLIFTPETLREEFKKYDPSLKMRDYIEVNNNIEIIAKQYENIDNRNDS